MRKYLGVFLLFFCVVTVQAQFQTVDMQSSYRPDGDPNKKEKKEIGSLRQKAKKDSVAPIIDYKIISIKNDTIAVDTALSVKKHYEFNYLRKDPFGLLQFANEGQTYNILKYNYKSNNVLPGFGFEAKQFAYLNVEDIKYYSAPTPYTDLYYRSVMKQGQNLDAFITLNTSKNLNFFVGYKGLRSLGKYINQLSSTGNFRIGSSYQSEDKKYLMRAHFTAQDIMNKENGGIRDLDLFESSVKPYNKRERLNVYYRDVETMLKGKRLYLNHQYQLNNSFENGILLTHEFTYEDKFFEYKQGDINNQYNDKAHFGEAFKNNINNKTRYYNIFNRVGAAYQSDIVGRFEGFVDFYKYSYYYKSIAHVNGTLVPDKMEKNISMLGGRYIYHKENWKANVLMSTSLGDDKTRNVEANLDYKYSENIALKLGYQNLSRMGNLNYYLYQSDYVNYNWYNEFKNEKVNQFDASVTTPWVKLSGTYAVLDDKLYFSNDATEFDKFGIPTQVLVTPKQYGGTINYLSIQAEKDFRFGKFGLDNTFLYQKVDQKDNILNVPEFVTRNTLYFTDAFFDKALKFQTGITLSYFTKYYGNDYNPVIGDFFVQDQVKIGNYPVFDFFINMKIRTARIYLMLEHFNSSMTGYKYYSAPNNPYKDFTFRFGISWNFFS
ncbi:putative porin [Myroides marinus]|uniref:putative porin n=1 Tax=Myroides marinus TaxID=703342 RepID=UPI0025783ED5|nr:putative porin [Myroides marinus]MDM1361119.1 putative porin [Myroides marinus]